MDKEEILFKNPARNNQNKQFDKYIPEYKRLDITPAKVERTPEEEFISENKRIAKEREEESNLDESQQISILSARRAGLLSNKDAEALELEYERNNRNLKLLKDNKDLISEDDVYSEPIKSEEISFPDNTEDNNSEFSFKDINIGDYVLIHNDSVIDIGTIDSIKEILSNILLDSDQDLNIDDFVVMKKMKLQMGIFINGAE